jgi:putative flippase GtrA
MMVKFMAFTLVGAIGTLVHYSILYALVEGLRFNPVWASGWGALAGLVINYVLNYSLTFKSQQSHVQTLPKFALIALLGLGLNLALMALLTPHLYYLYAQVVTTGVVLIWNFFANSLWTFKLDSSNKTVADKPASPYRKTVTGFISLLSDRLNKSRCRTAFALCIPLLLLGLLSAYPFSAIDFFGSKKPLNTASQQTAPPAEYLLYFMERPYSAPFYLQGQGLPLSDITLLQDGLTDSNHDVYAPKNDLPGSLPEAVTLRLERINPYGTFTLFHARRGDKK